MVLEKLISRYSFPQNYQCGTFAGLIAANLVSSGYQTFQLRHRIMNGDPSASMPEKVLSVLERCASGTKTASESVLQIMNSHSGEAYFFMLAASIPRSCISRAHL
jgi:hypothetical protein